MIFTNPVKSIEGTHLKSTCEDVKIESAENLEQFENDILNVVTEKSQSWFNKTFTIGQMKNKYNKKTFEKGLVVKGLLFYKDKFELDTYTSVVEEVGPEINHDFFDLAKEFFQSEPISVTTNELIEPVKELELETIHKLEQEQEQEQEEQEQEQKTVQPMFVEVLEPIHIEHMNEEVEETANEDLVKKKNYCTIAKQIKEKLKKAIDNEDLEKALKLSQILAQLKN